ncbi:hypothetical protein [Flagellimonas sp. S3867]|uniref:hypothetical protein n=1 Tax=Flagellimonas sp. S3867 TaxID=2768063 RepID=UPI001689B7B4|nr:hypothetical protein [Flagellimonas sp. S3867]
MDIVFVKNKRELLRLNTFQFILCNVGLMGIVWLILSIFYAENVYTNIEEWFSAFSSKERIVGVKDVLSMILTILTTTSFVILITKFYQGYRTHRLIELKNRNTFNNLQELIEQKTFDEFKGIKVISESEINKQIEEGKKLEKSIDAALNEKLINNLNLNKVDWTWDSNYKSVASSLFNIPIGLNNLIIELEMAADSLKSSIDTQSKGKKIKIFVATVQPSIIALLTKILERHKLHNTFELITRTTTGPQTISKSYTEKLLDSDGPIIFIAPISAFLMYEGTNKDINGKEVFYPFACLFNETQNILTVEGHKSSPIKQNNLFYYNNSTAEELVLRIKQKKDYNAREYINFISVDNYETYLSLLKYGRSQDSKLKMSYGDSIVTWSPLTDMYRGKNISDGYFWDNGFAKSELNFYDSSIFLFIDNTIFSSHTMKDVYFCFARLMLLELEIVKNTLDNKSKSQIRKEFNLTGLVKNYEAEFKRMIQI